MKLPSILLLFVIAIAGCFGLACEASDVVGFHAVGSVAPFQEIEIAARSDGIVNELLVEDGDAVTNGQALVRLESVREQLEVEYQSQLLEKRASDLQAIEDLHKEKIVSTDEFQKRSVDWKLAETQYRLAKQKLDEKTIRCPVNGFVVRLYRRLGESIEYLKPAVRVAQVDSVYVVVNLDQQYLDRVKRGQVVEVRLNGLADKKFSGEIRIIDPVVDPASGLFRIKVLVENSKLELRAGLKADVYFGDASPAQRPSASVLP